MNAEQALRSYALTRAAQGRRSAKEYMKRSIAWFLFLSSVILPTVLTASQLVSVDADKLEALSDIIVVATVNTVERGSDNTIPKVITDFDIVTVTVAFVLKGSVPAKEIKIRLAVRGNRAFDPAMTQGDAATFFLKQTDDEIHRTAYPGSVSLFPRGHFKSSEKTVNKEPEATW